MQQANNPIGVFDSGMGGLTVLSALREVLPHEHFVYLGDTARLPYGTKSPRTVRRYAKQAADQLVQRHVKALVVACNTASGLALDYLQDNLPDQRVFGVVQPGAQAASATADSTGVLVLATESTIQGGAYQSALTRLRPQISVFGRACPLWVTLAEQGPQDVTMVDAVLRNSLRGFETGGPSTILLGCTHFPVFAKRLGTLLDEAGRGEVRIVSSAQTTAADVKKTLKDENLLMGGSARGDVSYLATDGIARFRQVGAYFLGDTIGSVELVDL